jgi:glycosyltransferase involved in cell wall biosynthesis
MTDQKGNDVMLRAFGKYLKVTEDASTKLVLVEKGPDVKSSKALCESLGIRKSVVWVNEMKREELDRYYQGATFCFGHFGTPVITYSVLEALANGTVSLSFSIEDGHPVPCYKENPPIFNTDSPEAMVEFMIQLLHDPNRMNDLSYQSWLWVRNNCSEERFVEAFLALCENTSVSSENGLSPMKGTEGPC